jgi:pyruvate dehydrogenase E2 component (dihydrolipoamide acetyltransferase)
MKTGTVVQWFKKEGESVQKGEPLVEVLSEKVTYDVEAPESGVLRKILAVEGIDVPVAEAIGLIAAPDEEIPEAQMTVATKEETATRAVPRKDLTEGIEERVMASPAAKRLAREHGVDLSKVVGTGPDGRIVEEDVKKLVEAVAGSPRVREVLPLTGIRKTTAERLSQSFRTAPHSTVSMDADMSEARKLHEETQASYTDILVKAVANALKEHVIINSTLDGEQIKIYEDINVGVAVATEKGLVVPVVHNADRLSLKEISSVIKALVEKAREGKLTKNDLTGGTFTVTNLGMYGVDFFIPIINPPETAILGVGRVAEKPVVADNALVAKPVMNLSLAYDHRVVDGAPAAQFLRRVKQLLETPSRV